MIGPELLDPSLNGRRAFPVCFQAFSDSWGGSPLQIEVWKDPKPPHGDVVVSVYGETSTTLPDCGARRIP